MPSARSVFGSVFTGRSFAAALALAVPTLIVLVVLAISGALAWIHVFSGGVIVVAALLFLVHRHLGEIAAVIATADALCEPDGDKTVTRPRLAGRLANDALAAVLRLDRAWRARADALRGGVGENKGVFDSLPDPLILLDARRRVTFGNAAARQLLGTISVGADLAMALRDPGVLEAVDGVLADGVGRQADFHPLQPAERHLATRIEKLRAPEPGGAVCVLAMVDLTAMKRIEQMRSDFIANASHELRTPLSSLIGFIETLQGPARDDVPARDQFLKLMHEQAHRMARLVRDLLSLSMIEMSEHKPPAGQVDLPSLLQTVVAILQLQARAKSMTVKIAVEAPPQGGQDVPAVPGDSDQLAQLFQNLIDNAIKYGAANSEVAVRVWRISAAEASEYAVPATALAVSVIDKGEGIPEDHLPRLTERFYRVDTARSRAVGGTGLGLAIVKHIVARHRGHLRIDSVPGQGSRFTVFLPTDVPAPTAE
ncbi:MAG TPA: ATP-binding protein [Alphaproteobacteria bacterium]|jgi:two-component system phosphate regulon sensor histidine kinase PhoR